MSASKTILLKSSDGQTFEVEESTAVLSEMIKYLIEDCYDGDAIPLMNVDGRTLAKVIEYCKRHTKATSSSGSVDGEDREVKAFDEALVKDLKEDQDLLFDLLLAANYLNIKTLLDLTCATAADMMKGKTPEQIRKMFHIKNDFTPEKEAEIRKENAWAFE